MTLPVSLLVAKLDEADDARIRALDCAVDVIASGVPLSEVAAVLGITRQTVTDRFVPTPQARELNRARVRITDWRGRRFRNVRVSFDDRFVVFDDGHSWRVLRHTVQPADAAQLAAFIGRSLDGCRFIGKPRDLTEVVMWSPQAAARRG